MHKNICISKSAVVTLRQKTKHNINQTKIYDHGNQQQQQQQSVS